jgi:hypothetical protein
VAGSNGRAKKGAIISYRETIDFRFCWIHGGNGLSKSFFFGAPFIFQCLWRLNQPVDCGLIMNQPLSRITTRRRNKQSKYRMKLYYYFIFLLEMDHFGGDCDQHYNFSTDIMLSGHQHFFYSTPQLAPSNNKQRSRTILDPP